MLRNQWLQESKEMCKAHNVSKRPAKSKAQGSGLSIKEARKLGSSWQQKTLL